MTLVSSANNILSDIEVILRGRSFIYIMNNTAPGIDPWGLQFAVYSSQRKNSKLYLVILLQLSVFY
jgi:hypothetical protein